MVALSTATADQVAQLLREEIGVYASLISVLKAEQQALTQGAVEELARLSSEKSSCVERINAIEARRQPLSDNETSRTHLSLSELWQDLTKAATEARDLNLTNGRLINTRLQRTQDALAVVLRTNDERDPTYGPDGQATSTGGGRPLASA